MFALKEFCCIAILSSVYFIHGEEYHLLFQGLPNQGLSQAAPLRQFRTAIGIVPLRNGQGDNLSPSKFWEKTRKEAHTKRFISVQKLQAETDRGKYILSHL